MQRITDVMLKRTRILKRRCWIIGLVMIINFFMLIFLMTYSFQVKQDDLRYVFIGYRTGRSSFNLSSYQIRLTNDSSLGIVIKDISLSSDLRYLDNEPFHLTGGQIRQFLSQHTDKPFLPTNYRDVYIFSAIGRSSIKNASVYVVINVWEAFTFKARPVFCCYFYEDGKIDKRPVITKSSFLNHSLTSAQVVCNTSEEKGKPIGVMLVYDHGTCFSDVNSYVKVVYPKPCSFAFCFAICTKIAYGYVNPEIITEWMEYYKYMGVSSVVTFAYNLTSEAVAVLRFYEKQGLVEVLPFDYPAKDSPVHKIGEKDLASWTDEQLTVYDCHDRLRGYDFVGIIDLDEFLVPRHGDFQNMLIKLSKKYPKAASFTFMSEIHTPEWGRDRNVSSSLIPQFTKHTKPMIDRSKVVHMPKHVVPGGITTHGILPKAGYERAGVPYTQAILKHYRPCRKEWITERTCFNRTLYTDTRMADLFKNIDAKIAVAKQQIFGIKSGLDLDKLEGF